MLFAWGWTGFGQTGTGTPGVGVEQGVDSPLPVVFPAKQVCLSVKKTDLAGPSALVSLSAGNFHSACVDNRGRLFTWGNARHGELGHPATDLGPRNIGTPGPDREEEPTPRRVQMQADASEASNSRTGTGGQGSLLNALSGTERQFRLVACGMYHTVALCESGAVFSWGSNDCGQLGLGKYGPLCVSKPVRVDALATANVFCLAAGDAFSAAVGSSAGGRSTLFTWGDNCRGQLGRSTGGTMVDKFVGFVKLPAAPMAPSQNSDVSSNGGTTSSSDRNGAQEVANNSEKISMVACGAEHMVVLTRSGAVYAVGANDEGQLGTGDPKERAAKQRANEKPASKYTSSFSNSRRVTAETEPTDPAPTRVAFFLQQSVIVTWIAAGGNATAALGMCFSPTGSLFDDSPKKTSQQTRRKASSKAEPPRTPRSQLWTWGSNAAGQLGCGRVEVKRQWEPGTVSIDGGPNTRVISVAMGEDHAVALVTEELENLAEESNSVEFKEDEESEDESEQEGEGGKSKEGGEDQETSSKSADWHRRRRAREPAEAAAASEKHAAEAARAAGGSESSSEDPFVKRSNGVVQGRVLTWGRSAAGRLGVGDPEKYRSHLLRGGNAERQKHSFQEDEEGEKVSTLGIVKDGIAKPLNKEQGRASNISGNSGGSAFWESMAAVYHDEGYLTFYSPVVVPFDPFRQGGALFRGHGSNASTNCSAVDLTGSSKVPTLTLRGIAVGGAHTFVYGSLKRPRTKSKDDRCEDGQGEDDEDEEEDGRMLEFPATANSGRRGGWRSWCECPNLGCQSVLPDELAEWHRVLCEKPPPPPSMQDDSSGDGLSNDFTVASDTVGEDVRRLPPLKHGGHGGGKSVLEKVSAARRKFESESLAAAATSSETQASPSPVRTKVVKKRVGGGYVYVTVPDLQPDQGAPLEMPAPRALGFEGSSGT